LGREPHLSVTLAILSSITSLGALIYFIDIVSESIHLWDTIANRAYCKKDRGVILAHGIMVLDGCIDKPEVERDRRDIEERYEVVVKACQ
jgi:uncharacterized membrane protein